MPDSKILIGDPETLFNLLEPNKGVQSPTETKFKGYRVKVNYDALPKEEEILKRNSVAKIVLESLRKMKNKK